MSWSFFHHKAGLPHIISKIFLFSLTFKVMSHMTFMMFFSTWPFFFTTKLVKLYNFELLSLFWPNPNSKTSYLLLFRGLKPLTASCPERKFRITPKKLPGNFPVSLNTSCSTSRKPFALPTHNQTVKVLALRFPAFQPSQIMTDIRLNLRPMKRFTNAARLFCFR